MKKLFLLVFLSIFVYANDYMKEADKQYAQGNFDNAITLYTKAISANPKNFQAYIKRGLAYYELKDYRSAVNDYTNAISLKPNYTSAYLNRGVSYTGLGDYKNASEDARKACSLGDCEFLDILKAQGKLKD